MNRPLRIATVCVVALSGIDALAEVGPRATFRGLHGVVDNPGLHPPEVRYVARAAGQTVFFTSTDVVYVSANADATPIRLRFVGARDAPDIGAFGQRPGRINVLKGADASAWRTGLQRFSGVRYTDLYPGIDAVFHADRDRLKSDFIVAPGADPKQLTLRYDGARDVTTDVDGALVIDTGHGYLIESPPLVYQRAPNGDDLVDAQYVIGPGGRGNVSACALR